MAETGTVASRRDLALSCNNLGDICLAEGDLCGVRRYYERAYEIDEQLMAETGTVESRRDLSVSCNNLGNICRAEGDLPGAHRYYERCYELAEQLVAETNTVQARQDFSIIRKKLEEIKARLKNTIGVPQAAAPAKQSTSPEDELLRMINAEAAVRGTIPAAKPQSTANPQNAAGSAEDELLRMINAEAERQGKK